jgi:hypothetical protein
MCHDQPQSVTRRAVLAMSFGLCLATTSQGCSPAGQAPRGAAGIPDRLKKMRALRGTGDPRWQGKRSPIRAHRESRPR